MRRIAQVVYVIILVIGFSTYWSLGAEIQLLLLAAGDPSGWAAALPLAVGAASLFLAFALSVFFSIPAGPLFYIAFGYWYGPFAGMLIASLAATAGSLGAFCFFRSAVPHSEALKAVPVRHVFATLLLLRCSPWIPNPLITVFCGAYGVGIGTFTLATFLGTMPLIAVYTLAASRLRADLDVSVLYSPEIALAFGLLMPFRLLRDHLRAVQAAKLPATAVRSGAAG